MLILYLRITTLEKCDLQLEGNKVEIKSFIDDFRYGPKIGNSLQDETIGSLKRDKFWGRINECLLKENINLAIVHVVSTSLGMATTNYYDINLKFEDTLKRALVYGNDFKKKPLLSFRQLFFHTTLTMRKINL